MATYGAAAAPVLTPARFLQPEMKVVWNPTLETASFLARSYNAPVGGVSGTGIDLGRLIAVAFKQTPTFTEYEQVNIRGAAGFEITGEEAMLNITIAEFSPEVMAAALGTGVINYFNAGAEAQITFGGLCAVTPHPIVLHITNVACELPATADVRNGITGGLLTLYKAIISGGLSLDNLSARASARAPLEIRALEDTTRARGNRLGNLYLY